MTQDDWINIARSSLSYDSSSGKLTRLPRQPRGGETRKQLAALRAWNAHYAGKEAGSVCVQGYWQVGVGSKMYKAHRVVWALVTGEEPPRFIDHINGDPLDNRFENLRRCTSSQNSANTKRHSDSRTGVKGVSVGKGSKFKARVMKDGKDYYLGTFNTVEAAKAAYDEKSKELFGEFARSS